MKNRLAKITLFAVSLLLSASLAFAVEVKVNAPDVSGAAKSAADKTKASAAAAKDNAKGTAAGAKSAAKAKVIDINTATDAEMKAIPGIGDSYAAKIIAGRPYANKAQLKSRNILPGPVYEQVKDLIIAKKPSKK
ncbi:MAG: helix-hairpin-helix domain-containing protein [Steroidobacteraceae bacterium]|nr:helix-hairpin-helix domain-containing protein [Deltaproteobacteria bacterium]